MTFKLLDRVRMSLSGTAGTGTLVINAATLGFRLMTAAGMLDGDTTSYLIEDGSPAGSAWEIGVGTWHSNGTFTRDSITVSSLGGATPISVTASAILTAVLRAEDVTPYTPPVPPSPAVVQSAYVISTSSGPQTITLGTAPVAGNLLVTIGFGGGQNLFGGGYSPGLYGVSAGLDRQQSWTLLDQNTIGYAMHTVRSGESATQTVGLGDPASTIPFAAVAVELSGVDVTRVGEFLMSRASIPTGGSPSDVNVLSETGAVILGFVGGSSGLSMSGLTSLINQTSGSTQIELGSVTTSNAYGGMAASNSSGTVNALIMALAGAA